MIFPAAILIGYACGSIPFAWLFTYFLTGKDIRMLGDGNPGAANVAREIGKKWGVFVWIADTVKGMIVLTFAKAMGITDFTLLMFIGIAAILGHCFSVFLKFRGGKGAATSGGIIGFLAPKLFAVVVILWFLAERVNPRSIKVLISGVVIYFALLFVLYRHDFMELTLLTLMVMITGLLVNRKIFRTMEK